MRDCSKDQHVVDLFTRGSHHNDVTCIYLTQNLFPPGKYARTISLNSHYVVAFKNPRDAVGVRNLAQQAYPGRVGFVMDCFQDATSEPYGFFIRHPPMNCVFERMSYKVTPLFTKKINNSC